jgi:hypothetical protein
MAINRLAISNASANTDTVLYTSVRNCLTSVIATNKSNSQSLIRIWIVPAGQSGDSTKWMHIAYDSIVTGNNSLETFRFPLENGDLVYVRADSANISFSISGIYENSGAQKVYYDSTAPGAPAIGDIWVNSGASYANTNTSAVIAYQAAEPTTKSPNLLWVDSSGNNTVYANQYGVTGDWNVTGKITALAKDNRIGKSRIGGDTNELSSAIELGIYETIDTNAYIDFHSVGNNATDFETRIIRGPGINGDFGISNSGTGLFYLYNTGAGALSFGTNNIERLRILSDGKVGVGLSLPRAALEVAGSILTVWSDALIGTMYADGSGYFLGIQTNVSSRFTDLVAKYADNGAIRFISGASIERARFESVNGYLLLGYTSSNGAYRLQVNSQIFATSSTVATSDGRYKKNVNSILGGLDIIDALRPVSFDWKEHAIHNFPEGKTLGFIAQEVKESLQDYEWVDNLVKTNYNEELDEEFLGIAEGNIIPLLVSAVKELKAEVEILKGQING